MSITGGIWPCKTSTKVTRTSFSLRLIASIRQEATKRKNNAQQGIVAIGFATHLFCLMVNFSEHIQEYFIDCTYKTNKLGGELFGIIAHVNGVGYPLGYMLYGKSIALSSEDEENPKAITIREWFTQMKDLGFDPKFFFTDKDAATMQAIRVVFGDGPLRLCLWHLKRKFVISEAARSFDLSTKLLMCSSLAEHTYVWCTIQNLPKDWSDIIQKSSIYYDVEAAPAKHALAFY